MKIDFEKQLMMGNKEMIDTNPDEFLVKLHSRIKVYNAKRHTFFASSAMVFTVIFLILTQFGAPEPMLDNYFVDSTDNFLVTDFWDIESDYLDYDQEFYDDMAYFLLDEGYVWETIELIDQLEVTEEES